MRFGLNYINYSTPDRRRYMKESAKWYSSYIKDNKHFNNVTSGDFQYVALFTEAVNDEMIAAPETSAKIFHPNGYMFMESFLFLGVLCVLVLLFRGGQRQRWRSSEETQEKKFLLVARPDLVAGGVEVLPREIHI